MTRPTHDELLMDAAKNVARRSTCSRLSVGAVLTKDTRPISWGYNGAPSGIEHCDHKCDCGYPGTGGKFFEGKHMSNCATLEPCAISVHAEVNAIAFAAQYGIATAGGTLYCTHQPCLKCAQLIINAGIVRVYFDQPYRDYSGIELLASAEVHVVGTC